jgi:hypothetical protein
MSKIFRAKFFNEMKKAKLASKICPDVWRQAWVVNCQAVGTGANSVKYLAPYVFKVAISNSRIVKLEDGEVFFKYRKSGSNRWRTMSLQVMEFIRRFCQHVLPSGFMKVRYYGFMNPASSMPWKKSPDASHGLWQWRWLNLPRSNRPAKFGQNASIAVAG